ncbi:MAG: DUF6116 family protein [Planctomycetaceae bacterium]
MANLVIEVEDVAAMGILDRLSVVGLLTRFFSRLRFPWLFAVVLTLFGLDFLLPDPVPLMDELLLGTTMLLLGAWKQRKSERGQVIETTAETKPKR